MGGTLVTQLLVHLQTRPYSSLVSTLGLDLKLNCNNIHGEYIKEKTNNMN